MKKVLVVLLIASAAVMAFAGQYQWAGTPLIGNKIATEETMADSTLVNAPGLMNPYMCVVTPNHKAWTTGYGSGNNRVIYVWDAVFEVVDTVDRNYTWQDSVYLMGSTRFGQVTGEGNLVYGNWGPEFMTVFDKDDYSVVDQSPWCSTSGGVEAFVYNGEQYYLTATILATDILLWDSEWNVIDTLKGGLGGRNIASTSDGSIIVSPGLGSTYFIEYAGSPDDGYVRDTVFLADLGILAVDVGDVGIGNLMYVSRGPNDYIWLMSRDHKCDGVFVVDPKNDYEVKLSTYTDSSITSVEDFSLGMAVDNQWLIWRNTGVIDSSDYLTSGLYQTPQQLRAPCQVSYYYDGTTATEYLYLGDYYGYTLKLWTREADVAVEDVAVINANGFELNKAYPNPFNPTTTIPYVLSSNGNVTIDVYDVAGKKVQTLVNEYKFAGNYEVTFNAGNLASGNYYVKMSFGDNSDTQKISLLK
ncbi:MAG: T9SS type A sorting domain-containing protein [bacterium]|jgi:hypothetical protein|nr:T9SS type A sorting domain-containing protein [bacterium]